MKTYQWILFDADETLFRFDAFGGLKLMFANFGVQFTEKDYKKYQQLNKSLWHAYQRGEVSAQHVKTARFSSWAEKLDISAESLNSAFLLAMLDICSPLEGALNLLDSLKGKAKLGIITNGFTELQQLRLERVGFKDHFELLVVSEAVGYAKPHPRIFEHAFELMGNPPRDQVLMVGDTPESDILGGLNFGVDTCWLNTDNKPIPLTIMPHYQVATLSELEKLLKGA